MHIFTPYGKRVVIGTLLILALALMALIANAADVTLAWNASVTPGVTGYRVHYGQTTGAYTTTVDAGSATTKVITGLMPGERYFFAAKAYDGYGQTSGFSNEVAYTVPLPPAPIAPINLRVIPTP